LPWPSPNQYFRPVSWTCSRRSESKVDCAWEATACFAPFTSRLEILAIKPRVAFFVKEPTSRLHARLLFVTSVYSLGLHVADERENSYGLFSPSSKLTRTDARGE